MRRQQVWSIALKDLADFRTSKYAMYSIIIPPIVLGAVMPAFYRCSCPTRPRSLTCPTCRT